MPAPVASFLLAVLLVVSPLAAVQPPEEAEEAEEPSTATEGGQPPQSERLIPELDVYFPEGELDIRINRLVKKVFAEGQVRYNFVDGDISAFLRYRYYGYARTYQLSVFDEIEFEDIEDFSND
ncbi:MAG TPA: hypothetical protein VLF66_17260, partial [Thermoanaerobaculia bacterium]|nr:hypothetical protein [Thermoanaerobaculia bacterium]